MELNEKNQKIYLWNSTFESLMWFKLHFRLKPTG
jgi:hypothetical protein